MKRCLKKKFRKNDAFTVLEKVIVRRQYPIRIPKTAKLEYGDGSSQYPSKNYSNKNRIYNARVYL